MFAKALKLLVNLTMSRAFVRFEQLPVASRKLVRSRGTAESINGCIDMPSSRIGQSVTHWEFSKRRLWLERHALRDDQFARIENLLPGRPGMVGRNSDRGKPPK